MIQTVWEEWLVRNTSRLMDRSVVEICFVKNMVGTWPGFACLAWAWPGLAMPGLARPGLAWPGLAWHGLA